LLDPAGECSRINAKAMLAPRLAELLIFAACMAPVVYTDARERRIPDLWLLLAGAGLLALRLARGSLAWTQPIGALAAALLLLGVRLAFGRRLGLGDVKLAALIGFLLGFPGCLLAVFLGASAGTGFVLLRRAVAGLPHSRSVAFGPFLVSGAVAAFLLLPLLEAFWRL
jgi:prepilin signal peptidase PulO-like enzyme (type II secretory pathway)